MLVRTWGTRPVLFSPRDPVLAQLGLGWATSVHSDMAIRTLSTREVYRNPWLRLREDTIERSNGSSGIYSVIDKQDCAIILPIEGDHIWLVEQFRYTIAERALELPQGGWEADNVDPEELARGELREETGLRAGRMHGAPLRCGSPTASPASANSYLSPKNWSRVHTNAIQRSRIWRSSGCLSLPSNRSSGTGRSAMSARSGPGEPIFYGGKVKLTDRSANT